jgi:hypothetical protein
LDGPRGDHFVDLSHEADVLRGGYEDQVSHSYSDHDRHRGLRHPSRYHQWNLPSNDGDLGGGDDSDDDLASRQAPNAEFIIMIIDISVVIITIFITTMVSIATMIIFNMILVVNQSPDDDEGRLSKA